MPSNAVPPRPTTISRNPAHVLHRAIPCRSASLQTYSCARPRAEFQVRAKWGTCGGVQLVHARGDMCAQDLTIDFESGPGSHPNILQGLPTTSRDVQQQALIPALSVLLFSANVHRPPS